MTLHAIGTRVDTAPKAPPPVGFILPVAQLTGGFEVDTGSPAYPDMIRRPREPGDIRTGRSSPASAASGPPTSAARADSGCGRRDVRRGRE